jgi:hypothetical protein
MDSKTAIVHEFRYDVFLSYSRKDGAFARRLEQELGRYRPPKDLPVPQHYLRVFRDEADFTGSEYHESLDRNLRDAAKLIVVCSPNSASSPYVADEIRRFSEYRGRDHIIPILLDGVPNNEAEQRDDGRKAFPEQLVQLLPIPLAADYRNFDAKRDKLQGASFAYAWSKVLADIYASYGVDRAQIEQREHRRKTTKRRTVAAISSSILLAIIALTIWALASRTEAKLQQDKAEARRSEVDARHAFESGDILNATLLAAASVRLAWTLDAQIDLIRFVGLLPRPPEWDATTAQCGDSNAVWNRRPLQTNSVQSR